MLAIALVDTGIAMALSSTTPGALTCDMNGSAPGGAVQFATLTAKPAITAADFVIVA